MIAIEIDFLTGRYVAARHDDRAAPEWPPHPARLYSALLAEWATAEEPSAAEEAVLRHMESFGPPLLTVGDAHERTPVTHYVPVNDSTVIGQAVGGRAAKVDEALAKLNAEGAKVRAVKAATTALARARNVASMVAARGEGPTSVPESMPQGRGRQPRTFPSVTLVPGADGRCVVTMQWPNVHINDADRGTLDALLSRVTRLGHSSSLVSCRLVTENVSTPTLWPSGTGTPLRTVGAGQFDALTQAYASHQGHAPRTLASSMTWYSSKRVPATLPFAVSAGAWTAFEIRPRLDGRALPVFTTAAQEALRAQFDDADVGLIALGLPNVDHPHASGDVLGGAVLIPRSSKLDELGLLRALSRGLGGGLQVSGVHLDIELNPNPHVSTLRHDRWAGPARVWASATPLMIAGSPHRRLAPTEYDAWVTEWIAESCERADLPRPSLISTANQPLIRGTLPVRAYASVSQAGRKRRLTHVWLEFPEPVQGPLVLGGGRHLGWGLFAPRKETHE